MPKTIDATLLAHMGQPATTLCYLLKVGPLPDDSYMGFTSLDRNISYDDGTGALTYYASTGAELSSVSTSNDLSVDNGEAKSLIPVYPNTGITQDMVDGGVLDGVEFAVYKINYNDLTPGRHEQVNSGPIGEVVIRPGGLVTCELRSWSQLLKQNSVCELDSLSCRVKRFGSQPGEERFPCMYDLTGEWVTGVSVTSVGTETVREFTASSLGQAADYFAPGLLTWTSGNNAGTSQEVDAFASGGGIALRFTTRFPVQIGDQFDIRRDCTRQYSGHNSCDTYSNRPWFRGEPYIPVADSIGLTVPGAGSGGSFVASGEAV